MSQIEYLLKRLALFTIKLYQKTISFDHGIFKSMYPNGYCKFYPTCSEYAVQAIEKKGITKGTFLTLRRLSKCHPWSQGGVDEVV